MQKNVGQHERIPRIVMALAAGTAALWAPTATLKTILLAIAGGMLTTVATGYCPVNRLAEGDRSEPSGWRTIKTWRVEASPASS